MDLSALEEFVKPLQHLISSIENCKGDNLRLNSDSAQRTEFANPSYPDDLSHLLNSITALRKHLRVVDGLRRVLNERVTALRKECLPLLLEDGIKRLPDEILARIFEIGHITSDGFSFALRVSHVSQRFRNVVLSSPALWGRFSTTQRPGQFTEFMSRSHQQVLEVTCKIVSPLFQNFFDAIIPQSMRWTYLHIDHKLLQFIPSDLPLNRVHTFSLNFVRQRLSDPIDGLCSIPLIFPLLHTFNGVNVIPTLTVYPSNLTTCSLRWSAMELHVVALLKFLGHLDNVRTVELSAWDVYPKDLPEDGSDDSDGSPIPKDTFLCSMPNVTTLSVTFGGDVKWRTVKGIFHSLVLPKLNEATISFRHVTTTYGVLEVLQKMLRFSNRPFQDVHTLRVDVIDSDSTSTQWRTEDMLIFLLKSLLTVRDLTINMPMAEIVGPDLVTKWVGHPPVPFPTEGRWDQFSSLKTLRFIDCHQLSERKLRVLAKELWKNTPDCGLQLLEVIGCRGISEDFLLELSSTMGDSLKWSFPTWKK